MIELQYVIETGATYFSTNIPMSSGIRLEVDYMYLPLKTDSTIYDRAMFGANAQLRISVDARRMYSMWGGNGTDVTAYESNFEGSLTLAQGYIIINGETIQYSRWGSSFGNNICVGALDTNGGDSLINGYIGSFRIYDNDVLKGDFIPAQDDNDVVCFWDNVTSSYFYPIANAFEAGPVAHTFNPDKSTIRFEQTGGTDTVTISAESDWTATTTDDWYTMDITSGVSGDTLITISIDSETEVKREGSIHFEDGDGYTFDITVKQKGIQLGQPLHLGELEISTLFLGGDSVTMAYLGEEQVYASGPFVGLKVSPKALAFNMGTTEKTLKVKSSEEWELTTDADWLTFSHTSGGTGETIVTVTSTAEEESTATITVTTTSFSASVDASYTLVHYVNGIHITTPAWEIPNRIDTGILGTEDTEVTIEYVATSVTRQTDRLAGYHTGDPGCMGDSKDFRPFYAVGAPYLDVQNSRGYGEGNYWTDGQTYKLTFGNCFLYDELNDSYIVNGIPQSMSDFANIFVDVGTISLKSLSIKQNNAIVFDGYAAELDGNVGLFDSISGQLVYNPNLDMTYDE